MLNIIYARVSSDEQAKDGKTSLQEQVDNCTEYLQRFGHSDVKIYLEDYSGYEFNRPELDKIKNLIEQRQVKTLTFLRVDRLTRQSGHLDQLREMYLIPYGVEVHSLDMGQWTWEPANIFLQNSLVNFAQLWGSTIKGILHNSRLKKIKNGSTMAMGRPPYGYSEVEKYSDKGELIGKEFIINPSEARVITDIFDMYVYRQMSLMEIVRYFNNNGVPSYSHLRETDKWRRNDVKGEWHNASLSRMLRNRTYIGIWEFGKRNKNVKNIEVSVPPIIEKKMFRAAAERLAKNNQRGEAKTTKHELLLNRRLRCHCGRAITHRATKRHDNNGYYLYYRCPGCVKNTCAYNGCDSPTLKSSYLDDLAWEWLAGLLSNEGELEGRIKTYLRDQSAIVRPLEVRLKAIDKILKKKYKELDTLTANVMKLPEIAQGRTLAQMVEIEKEIKAQEHDRLEIEGELQAESSLLIKMQSLSEYLNEDAGPIQWGDMARNMFRSTFGIEEGQLTFAKKKSHIEKFNLQAELVKDDMGNWHLNLTCAIGSEILPLLYKSAYYLIQLPQNFYFMLDTKIPLTV